MSWPSHDREEKTLIRPAMFVLLSVLTITPAFWALSVMGRSRVSRRGVEQPSAENNWQNEDYAEYEKGEKLRSVWVSPLSSFCPGIVPERPIEW
jgi:hypothetical protein